MRYLWLLVVLGACGDISDHTAELAACQLISKTGDELAACLVLKYDWGADSAGPAKYAWQRQLDSIHRDHEEQAAVVLAAHLAEQRRLANEQAARDRARQARLARIDSLYGDCTWPYFRLLADGGTQVYVEGKARCWAERNDRLKRAGFPPEEGPPS